MCNNSSQLLIKVIVFLTLLEEVKGVVAANSLWLWHICINKLANPAVYGWTSNNHTTVTYIHWLSSSVSDTVILTNGLRSVQDRRFDMEVCNSVCYLCSFFLKKWFCFSILLTYCRSFYDHGHQCVSSDITFYVIDKLIYTAVSCF